MVATAVNRQLASMDEARVEISALCYEAARRLPLSDSLLVLNAIRVLLIVLLGAHMKRAA